MSGKPAARLSDSTICPVPGHGVTPVQTGSPDVLFNNLPAARLGDAAGCGQAVSGAVSASVLINGKNAALLGSTLSHGGAVISGSGDILIGDTVVTAPFSAPMPLESRSWIGFQIPAVESYAGWTCIAHFDDGTTLSSCFDANNTVLFSNPTGSVCTRLEMPVSVESEQPSVTECLLSIINGGIANGLDS